ncbi:hypothetical protein [Lacrimispora amygdalina]|uniref:hypothetical protein n=1 Tax=Lacrimispora amygdalina TaxID=253257 RepID=UPI000BE3BB7F|nr:hypothetical protein [Lacrimispora amygdalina]
MICNLAFFIYHIMALFLRRETGKRIDYKLDTIIGKESAKLFRKIEELEFSETRLKKAQQIELMAEVLGAETLFEGFCLVFYEADDSLQQLCKDYGCLERYNELAQNKVYQKRKKYIRIIADYAMAAVNLYGVIHATELVTLIHKYENKFDEKGYNHVDGSYKNTVMFTPEFVCTCTLHQLIGDSNIDQANEFLGYAMKVMNSVRMWYNHGCAPDEVLRQTPIHPEVTTIVPGS